MMTRHHFHYIAIAVTALLLQACTGAPQYTVRTGTAGLDSVRTLDVYRDHGRLYVLLIGPLDGHNTLRYLVSRDGGAHWSTPRPINVDAAPPFGLHEGNSPQIAAHGQHLMAVWSTRGAGWGGSGPFATALSNDGGKTWTVGLDPGDHGNQGEGFVNLVADASGTFHAIWLDSRTGQQGLRYARSDDFGHHWSDAQTIDTATCECCWVTLQAGHDGTLYALYRNIDPRDVTLATSNDGGHHWQRKSTVGAFDWHFGGCPHTGASLVTTDNGHDRNVRALVWTGKRGQRGLHLFTSYDGGTSWSTSTRIGTNMARRADIAALDNTHLAIVWEATTKNGTAIFATRSEDGGQTWRTPRRLSQTQATTSRPRIVADPNGYSVFWLRADGQWAMTRLPRL